MLNRAFAERYKVRLMTRSTLPEAQVQADRKRILQVLTNLISNAAKFAPDGSAVELEVNEVGNGIRISVQDRGPGIPEDFRARMFTRFSQADTAAARQKGGTGLGLAISKHLMELMNGHIDYEDRPGGGSTFWVELPKHPPSQ